MGENVTLESLKPRIEPKKIKRQGFKEQKHRQKNLLKSLLGSAFIHQKERGNFTKNYLRCFL